MMKTPLWLFLALTLTGCAQTVARYQTPDGHVVQCVESRETLYVGPLGIPLIPVGSWPTGDYAKCKREQEARGGVRVN